MQYKMHIQSKKGFTLIEVIIGITIFVIVATAVYSSFVSITRLAQGSQSRALAVALADEQFEIIRNLPYASIGLTNGIPQGVLPQNQTIIRGAVSYEVLLTIRNINLSTSTVQASDKLVEIEVDCSGCKDFQPVTLTGQISPANLQSAGNGGALVVQVFNGNGEPVQEATVDVLSVATSTITNTDVTNNYGVLNIIGVPQGLNNYKITVTKDGYSTEQTYPIGGQGNPNPTKPNVTVLNQQLTQVSFSIDRLSTLQFSSVTPLCVPIANVDFGLVGAKNIGASLPKYSQNLATNGAGTLNLNSMEWDTYTINPNDGSYDVAGINPDSPFSLNPGTNQKVQLVVLPKNGNSLMVSVVDSATHLPVSGATVRLFKAGYDVSKITGQGYLSQIDWSGGAGQDMYTDSTMYSGDNGSVDTATSSGDVVLRDLFGLYSTNATGTLESSTFDTGTTSNYYTLSWSPNNQPILTGANSLKLQFATNASSTDPWNFFGPDGTSNTYYTVSGGQINSAHNGKQYARYKAYLTTETSTSTPKLSDINFAYTSGCIPPGQVLFQNLNSATYTLEVSKNGYVSYSGQVDVANGWQRTSVELVLQ
jgi:prepilin-type N-terminal cleavage/methylation domain-containing protein